MIDVVNDRLQVENPSNGWPITAESGWQEYHNKVDQTFEEIVADLANTRFNKTVFEGTATAQAFEWDIAMETWKPTGLHIMVVSERTGMRVPTPKEWGDRDDKLHGQNGMTCTGLCRTVSP